MYTSTPVRLSHPSTTASGAGSDRSVWALFVRSRSLIVAGRRWEASHLSDCPSRRNDLRKRVGQRRTQLSHLSELADGLNTQDVAAPLRTGLASGAIPERERWGAVQA